MKRKELRTAICFISILIILLALASYYVRPAEGEVYDIISTREKIAQLDREKDNSIDVLFAGDSLIFRSISPRIVYDRTGITSYDLSDGAMRLCDQCVLIKEACRRQKPKLLVLEADVMTRSSTPYKNDYALPTNLIEKVLPIFHYHAFYKSLSFFGGEEEYDDLKGYQPIDEVSPYEGDPDYMTDDADKVSISIQNRAYLDDIVSFCDENDMDFMVMAVPSPVNYNKEVHNTIRSWCDAHDTEFVDMNYLCDEIGIDWNTDSKDGGDHLNRDGSGKVSAYIAEYIKERYDLCDHRGDRYYSDWDNET